MASLTAVLLLINAAISEALQNGSVLYADSARSAGVRGDGISLGILNDTLSNYYDRPILAESLATKATIEALADSSTLNLKIVDFGPTLRDSLNTVWTDSIKVGGINDSGLVLYIPGTANADTSIFFDYSGLGNDMSRTDKDSGAVLTSPDSLPAVGLYGMKFAGANFLQSDVNISAISSLSKGTIEGWIRTNNNVAGVTTIIQASATGDPSSEFIFGIKDGKFLIFVRENTGQLLNVTTDNIISDNEWHYITYTTKTGSNKLYIDGKQAAVTYIAGTSASNVFFNDVNDLDSWKMGVNEDNSGLQFYYIGFLDEIRIWSRALTAKEFKDRYNNFAIHNLFQTKANVRAMEDSLATKATIVALDLKMDIDDVVDSLGTKTTFQDVSDSTQAAIDTTGNRVLPETLADTAATKATFQDVYSTVADSLYFIKHVIDDALIRESDIIVSDLLEGAVRRIQVKWDTLEAIINMNHYVVLPGSLLINAVDISTPTTYLVYLDADGDTTVSTIHPDPEAVEHADICELRVSSIAGVATYYWIRRSVPQSYEFVKGWFDRTRHIAPEYHDGLEMRFNTATGAIDSVDSGTVHIATAHVGLDSIFLPDSILIDDETFRASFEDIDTYSDGSTITTKKFQRVLIGVITNNDSIKASIMVIRQSAPTTEYRFLSEAVEDLEQKAATSFGVNYVGNVIPIYYLAFKKDDASDYKLIDIRGTSAIGGGGSGAGLSETNVKIWIADTGNVVRSETIDTILAHGDIYIDSSIVVFNDSSQAVKDWISDTTVAQLAIDKTITGDRFFEGDSTLILNLGVDTLNVKDILQYYGTGIFEIVIDSINAAFDTTMIVRAYDTTQVIIFPKYEKLKVNRED